MKNLGSKFGPSGVSLSKRDEQGAFWIWKRRLKVFDVEEILEPYLSSRIKPWAQGETNWLRLAREARLLSTGQVATRAGMTRMNVVKLEASEEAGTISLKSLMRLAEAMDCELVYAIRPKERAPFAQRIWRIVLESAMLKFRSRKSNPAMAAFAFASMVRETMNSVQLRRKSGWTDRHTHATQ